LLTSCPLIIEQELFQKA